MALRHLDWARDLLTKHAAGITEVDNFIRPNSTYDIGGILKPVREFFFGDKNAIDTNLIHDFDIPSDILQLYRVAFGQRATPANPMEILERKFAKMRPIAVDDKAAIDLGIE